MPSRPLGLVYRDSHRLLGITMTARPKPFSARLVAEGEVYILDYDAAFRSYLDKLKANDIIPPSFLDRSRSHLLVDTINYTATRKAWRFHPANRELTSAT